MARRPRASGRSGRRRPPRRRRRRRPRRRPARARDRPPPRRRRRPAPRCVRARRPRGSARRSDGPRGVPRRPGARDEPRGAPCPRRGAIRGRAARAASPDAPTTSPPRRCSSSSTAPRGAPRFELTPEAAETVAEICRLVDGLPLAIELAAARTNVLGLAELLLVVERRLALLRERPAADAGRAALGTLVEWSYDLLHEDEKSLLHKVAVHRGGASLPSLVALGASRGLDEATVTYLLGVLVDKSILSVSFPAEGARYDLLDTVRDYALERLAEDRPSRRRPAGARRVLRDARGRSAGAASRARLADVARPARARARQPVGCAHVRARCTRQRHRRPPGVARLVLHARRARDRRAAIRRARARRGVGRRSVRSAARRARLPLLPRDRRARPRRRDRDRRARARVAATGTDRRRSAGAGDARACGRRCRRRRARRRTGRAGACHARSRRETTGRSQWPAFLRAHIAAAVGDAPRSRPWRRTRTATPTRSGSTPSASRRCCSMRGSPSGGRRRRRHGRVPSRTRSRGSSRLRRTTPLSPCPGLLHAPSRAETCATPKSSSGARSQPPRERGGLGRRPCARRARPHPRRGRRHRDRREAVPERPRVVEAAAPARAAREPLPRVGRRPGRGRCGRTGRPRRRPVQRRRPPSRLPEPAIAPSPRVAAPARPTAAVWQRRRPRLP